MSSRANQKSWLAAAAKLMSGTILSQLATVAILPALTRLYSPAEFDIFAFYVAIITLLSVIGCLRYEIAIPVPDSESSAQKLLISSLLIAALFSFFVAILIGIFGEWGLLKAGREDVLPYMWLIPIGILAISWFSALKHWALRQRLFGYLARLTVLNTLFGIITQLALSSIGVFGLLIGHIIISSSGVFGLLRKYRTAIKYEFTNIRWSDYRTTLNSYSRFPKYSVIEAFANNAGLQIPVLIIAVLALGPEAGYLLIATRAVGAPISMIAGAVSQIYLSNARHELKRDALAQSTYNILSKIGFLGFFILAIICFYSKEIFGVVFGSEWVRAAELVYWIAPWYGMKLLSSPISMVMHVKMQQRKLMSLTILGLILRVSMTLIIYIIDYRWIVEGYAVSGFVYYIFCYYIFANESGISIGKTFKVLSVSLIGAAFGLSASGISLFVWNLV